MDVLINILYVLMAVKAIGVFTYVMVLRDKGPHDEYLMD